MFEQSLFLFLLILIPISLFFFIGRSMVRTAALRRIGDPELVQTLLAQVSPFRRWFKSILWLITLATLILALARPVWGIEEQVIQTEGIQIIVAIDISRSMDATDVSPSRLVRARLDILDLLRRLEGNDIGLVVFAQEAHAYMPLSYDIDAVEVFLKGISTHMLSLQGTNIPSAIEIALGSFERRSPAQKVIILVTDGESHEGDAIEMAQIAAEQNVIIYTIGYGSPDGATIPIYDQNGALVDYKTHRDGSLVLSSLNIGLLQDIAERTNGFYIQGASDMTPLAADILSLQSGDIGEETLTRPIERFSIFVALALLALSLEILLPETRAEAN
jgi:Ca-activated chloride channel family protein